MQARRTHTRVSHNANIDTHAKITSELSFASECLQALSPPPKLSLVAVTGTNGKSTVTTFVGQLLNACGANAWVGGNLGVPLSCLATQFVTGEIARDFYAAAVVEVSSYQLQLAGAFAPDAAAILNVTPDHLARHGTMEAYAEAKLAVFANMRDASTVAVVPADDPALVKKAAEAAPRASPCLLGVCEDSELVTAAGAWLTRSGERALVRLPAHAGRPPVGESDLSLEVDLTKLRAVGRHNRANAAAACLLAAATSEVARDAGALSDAMASLLPPPHRMEALGEDARGVLWINDSKATNVESTIAGVGGLDGRRAVVLLGGEAKEDAAGALGMERLVPALEPHDCVVTFGASGPKIAAELRAAGLGTGDGAAGLAGAARCRLVELGAGAALEAAAAAGAAEARDGGALILSPACASFDQFRNFVHRGEVFAEVYEAQRSVR